MRCYHLVSRRQTNQESRVTKLRALKLPLVCWEVVASTREEVRSQCDLCGSARLRYEVTANKVKLFESYGTWERVLALETSPLFKLN